MYYDLDLCGRHEKLPIYELSNGIKIAFFNLHGNADLTEFCGKKLAKFIKNSEVLVTIESKGLQLTHVIARELNMPKYAVIRKTEKIYMKDGIKVEYNSSIMSLNKQMLYMSKHDVELIKNKKVCIVDDVISSGNSVNGAKLLIEKAGGIVNEMVFVLAEGEARNRTDIKYLSTLPLL